MADGGEIKIKITGDDSQFKNTVSKLSSTASNSLKEIGKAAAQATTSANGMVAPLNNIVTTTNRAQNAIQSFNRGWQDIKSIPSGLQNIGSTLKSSVIDGLTGAKLQTSLFAASLKALAQQKLSGLSESFQQLKTTLTEGKSGVSGFVASLKNIGKISVAGTVNSIKSLAQHTKEFASIKLNSIVSGLKSVKDRFTDGKSGASGLFAALKKVAGVTFGALHSGLSKIGSLAASAGKTVAQGLGSALQTAVKGVGVAAAAAATMTGTLVAKSVSAFGDYEQLVGGVETLFKDSAGQVQAYANEAYRTAGLSANEYMDTVTSFSASLLQSLGGDTEQAAQYADMAIHDMADNANKMGTDMQSIQWAYQGFAKQNFTMLDNLKLGYGGTKEEMERLLAKAEELTGKKFDISSFADITEAIHAVQSDLEMTGTSADEAKTTIQGSAAAMKASWCNMLVALTTGGENFDRSLAALIESVLTFGQNVIPAVEGALKGVANLIEGLAPIIAQELPTLISTVLPELLNAVTAIINSLMSALPGLLATLTPCLVDGVTQAFNTLVTCIPQILLVGLDLITGLAQGITSGLPLMMQTAAEAITNLSTGFSERIPTIIGLGLELIQALVQGISQNATVIYQSAISAIFYLEQGIISALPSILQSGLQLVMALVQGIISSIPLVVQGWTQLITSAVQSIVTMLPMVIQGGIQLVISLIQGIISNLGQITQAAVQIVMALSIGLIQAIPQLIAAVPQLIAAIIDTILNTNWLDVGLQIVQGIGSGLINGISGLFSGGQEAGQETASGVESGISAGQSGINASASAAAQAGLDGFSGLQETTAIGETAAENLASGFEGFSIPDTAQQTTDSTLQALTGIEQTTDIGSTSASNLAGGLSGGSSAVTGAATDIVNSTVAAFEPMNQLTTDVDSVMTSITTATQEKLSQLPTIATEQITAVQTAFTSGLEQIKSAVSSAMQSIVSIVASTNLYNVGANVVQGLINGMNSKLGQLRSVAANISKTVAEVARAQLQIHSPSRVFADIGKNVILGLADGLEDNARIAWYAMYNANERLLNCEQVYQREKQRIEDEAYDREYEEKIANAEDAEEIEKIKQEYILKAEESGRDQYLEILKKCADKEKELYEKSLKTAQDYAGKITDGRQSMIDKLSEDEELIKTHSVHYADLVWEDRVDKGFDVTTGELADLTKPREAYRKYADTLLKMKQIEGLPYEFFEMARDMSMDDGMLFAETFINADPEDLKKYIADWRALQEEKERISAEFYETETDKLAASVLSEFGEIPDELYDTGTESAAEFGRGFKDELKRALADIKSQIQAEISVMFPTALPVGASGGNTYNTAYYVQPSAGESTQAQLLALKSAEKINKYRTE